MNLPLVLLLIVLVLATWLMIRMLSRKDVADPSPPVRRPTSNSAFHAVSIKLSGEACSAAQAMAGRRFLSGSAPKLPLPECDRPECHCRFVHHQDRRSGKDRRSPFSPAGFGSGSGLHEKEQRAGRDRRSDDDDFD